MRINPINSYATQYLSFKSETLNTSHTQINKAINFDSSKKQTVDYPRRYLPQQYPATEIPQMTYDSFTGLRDKNYLLSVLNVTMSANSGQDISIAMFDMDNFKSVNELLGYQTGDNFIKAISKSVSTVAKQNSTNAYRFGGDEFVILFDKQSAKRQREIVEQVIREINSDGYLKSKEKQYRENAQRRLEEYTSLHAKIAPLIPLKTKRNLFKELQENFESKEAKKDPYLLTQIKETDDELNRLYSALIDERLSDETERDDTKKKLEEIKGVFERGEKLSEKEYDELDEYLLSIYDKTFEIHQIKRWIKDFDKYDGFSITGGVVSFSHDSIKNKTSLDIVNEAGEILKSGKSKEKGQGYYMEIK